MGEIKTSEEATNLNNQIRAMFIEMPHARAVEATMGFYSSRHLRGPERQRKVGSALLETEPNTTPNKG